MLPDRLLPQHFMHATATLCLQGSVMLVAMGLGFTALAMRPWGCLAWSWSSLTAMQCHQLTACWMCRCARGLEPPEVIKTFMATGRPTVPEISGHLACCWSGCYMVSCHNTRRLGKLPAGGAVSCHNSTSTWWLAQLSGMAILQWTPGLSPASKLSWNTWLGCCAPAPAMLLRCKMCFSVNVTLHFAQN